MLRAAAGVRLRPVPDCLPDQAPDDMPRVKGAVEVITNSAMLQHPYPPNDICIGPSLSPAKALANICTDQQWAKVVRERGNHVKLLIATCLLTTMACNYAE